MTLCWFLYLYITLLLTGRSVSRYELSPAEPRLPPEQCRILRHSAHTRAAEMSFLVLVMFATAAASQLWPHVENSTTARRQLLAVTVEGTEDAQGFPTIKSVCVLPSGVQQFGQSDCSGGKNSEVLLIGKYINLAISSDASFGANAVFNAPYYNQGKRLGFISDFDTNGFSALPSPSYAGDYFIPGIPLEGSCERSD